MASNITLPTHRKSLGSPAGVVQKRLPAAIELALVVGILEVGMWELCGRFDGLFRVIALPAVAMVVWYSHRRRRLAVAAVDRVDPSLARDTLQQAWGKTLVVTLGLSLLIPLLALVLRVEGEGFRLFWMEKGTAGLVGYLAGKGAFIVAQQVLLQYFLVPCCGELVPHRQAARFCAAIIFGLVHLPSLILVGITLVAGYCWIALFARGGRILPLAVSHLMLAVLAHATLPERMTLNMRVGARAVEVAQRYTVLDEPEMAQQVLRFCSDRYYAACGSTDEGFICGLYRDLLLRDQTPPAADVDIWRKKLAAHARTDVTIEFLNTEEFTKLAQSGRTTIVAQRLEERLAPALANHDDRRELR